MPYRGEDPCPHCKNSGFLHIRMKPDPEKGKLGEAIQPCCCINAEIIKNKFPILGTISDPPPSDFISIAKTFTEVKNNRRKIKNYVFYGSEKKFLYIYKSILLFYWNFTSLFELLDGIQVVHKYYTGQTNHTLYDLLRYELLSIVFTSVSNNQAMQPTILDTIKNRYRNEKSTWIYSTDESALKESQEYSDGLDEYLKSFKTSDLSKNFKYSGYSDAEESARKQRRSAQISVSNI